VPIHYEPRDDHILVITIDRPEAKNALDMYHFRDLAKAWRDFKDDDDLWIAIITGVNQCFMAGADLKTYIPQITKLNREIGEGTVDAALVGDDHRLHVGGRVVELQGDEALPGGAQFLGVTRSPSFVAVAVSSPSGVAGPMNSRPALIAGRCRRMR